MLLRLHEEFGLLHHVHVSHEKRTLLVDLVPDAEFVGLWSDNVLLVRS